ncbi:hypothetical protein [Salaquimonas pukyongi]|uniref:hypothetical protein n=1 Tax=Salaquimonas pukyongi TaxID=2712698 RepID=UPI00096B9DF7|nr:hypothetical protein [Salaquimonas pukyongi]
MPQLIAVGLVGGLIWYAWRALKRQMASVGEELRNQEQAHGSRTPRTVESLEKGEDGVYRPKDKGQG